MGDARVVKWEAGWSPGQFLAAVEEAGGLARGAVTVCEYRHEPDCPKLGGGACGCDPDVEAFIQAPVAP